MRLHRSLQKDDERRADTMAHAHPVLRHVEAARQPARRLQTTQQNPCLAFGNGFFQPFPRAAGMHHTFKKKVAPLSISDPGPPRGGAGGPVVPAAASGDLRGGVQRRTDGQRARGVQTRGNLGWKGLTFIRDYGIWISCTTAAHTSLTRFTIPQAYASLSSLR